MHHKRVVVFTDVSVYLVSQDAERQFIEARAVFGGYGENGHDWHGHVTTGPITVGQRFSFECECDAHLGNREVHSAEVTRIVEHTLRPARVVPEGYMDITPSWSGALRLLVEVREWQGLTNMALAADRYVAAVSLGLITQSDLAVIEARRTT